MRLDTDLAYLGSLAPKLVSEALAEVLYLEVTGVSVVPGFNMKRWVTPVRASKAKPKVISNVMTVFGADMLDCYDTPYALRHMPKTLALVAGVRELLNVAKVGMVTISRLEPGGGVLEHVDYGAYYETYHRLHVPLNTVARAYLTSGATELELRAGEVWDLNNLQPHRAYNDGASDRYNVIIDAALP